MDSGEEAIDRTESATDPDPNRDGRIRGPRLRRDGRRGSPGRSGRSDRSDTRSSKRAIRFVSVSVPVGILSVVGVRIGTYGRRVTSESGAGSAGIAPVKILDPSATAALVHDVSLATGVLAAFATGAFVLLAALRVTVRVIR